MKAIMLKVREGVQDRVRKQRRKERRMKGSKRMRGRCWALAAPAAGVGVGGLEP